MTMRTVIGHEYKRLGGEDELDWRETSYTAGAGT